MKTEFLLHISKIIHFNYSYERSVDSIEVLLGYSCETDYISWLSRVHRSIKKTQKDESMVISFLRDSAPSDDQ